MSAPAATEAEGPSRSESTSKEPSLALLADPKYFNTEREVLVKLNEIDSGTMMKQTPDMREMTSAKDSRKHRKTFPWVPAKSYLSHLHGEEGWKC